METSQFRNLQLPGAKTTILGGGEMGELVRKTDWSSTALGPIEKWPSSLVTLASTCLNSRAPFLIWWGPSLTVLYNDAYIPIFAGKHPHVLGKAGKDAWGEVWEMIGPMLQQVLDGGPATWSVDQLLLLYRNNFIEETFFTWSYSPIYLENGKVGGVLTSVAETTKRVLGERRLRTLRELGDKTINVKSVEEACTVTAEVISKNPADIPFSLIYLLDPGSKDRLSLKATTGISIGSAVGPSTIDLGPHVTDSPWSAREAIQNQKCIVIENPVKGLGSHPGRLRPEPPSLAAVIPIRPPTKDAQILGILIIGVSARLSFEDDYRGFFDLISRHLASAIIGARAYEEEKKRAEALAEIDRAKTLFFSNVSHEFRTPLTLMLGPAEDALLDRDHSLPTEQRERLEIIHRSALRLQKLVNSLLDFSRIEAGRVQAIFEPTDLCALTVDLASAFRAAIERAGMKLIVNCPKTFELAYVDRTMWEKIVLNLLSNAFKFTFKGEIEVKLEEIKENFQLLVRDTGIGIPENELPRLFERFHRVEGAKGRTQEGSGIGLALVQELVKFHGGIIKVTSKVDEGSRFTISIPKGSSHLPKDRISATTSLASTRVDPSAYVEEALRWLPVDKQLEKKTLTPLDSLAPYDASEYRRQAGVKPQEIVVVDDNSDMREYIKKLLIMRYRIREFEDGEGALRSIQENPPDLILTDVMMPKLDGFGLLKAVRSIPNLRSTPLILLSARAGEESRIEGLEAGADDYVVKPFSAKELLARISATLTVSRIRSEAAKREVALVMQTEQAKSELANVLTNLNDFFITFDLHWRFTFLNNRAVELFESQNEHPMGKVLWDAFPSVIGSLLEDRFRKAMSEEKSIQFEYFYPPWQKWFDIRVYPNKKGLSVFSAEITSKKNAEEALRDAIKARDEFLSIASHELRTPLTSMKMLTQMRQQFLEKGKTSEFTLEKIAQMLKVDHIQIERLTRLIDDMVDISRISTGRLPINPESFDLSELVSEVVGRLTPQLEAAGCNVTIDTKEPAFGVWDRYRIEQVFVNLLTNAMKYSAQKPIYISVKRKDQFVELQVRDEGKGIAKNNHERIFQRFERADVGSGIGGLGLGLYIVRQIVEIHGGTIRVESELEKGSTFIVNLPILPKREPHG